MKAISAQPKEPLYLFWSVAATVWFYLLVRAWFVPPLHDEVATFFIYVQSGKYIPGDAFWDANNHILNSALSHFFYRFFGSSVFVLRLASLLFFPLYAFYVYRWTGLFFEKTERAIVGVALLTVTALIEYFGYARGYGMGLACAMAVIYYLSAYTNQQKIKYLLGLSIFALTGLLASLNLLIVVLVAFAFAGCLALYRKKWTHALLLIANGWWLQKILRYSFELKKRGALYYGGENGFIQDTVQSLADLLLGRETIWGAGLLLGLALLSLPLLPFLLRDRKWLHWLFSAETALYALFWGNITAIILMHKWLDVNYPEDRTALHLLLLLLPMLFLALKRSAISERVRTFSILGLSMACTATFFTGFNLHYSTFWKNERLPHAFFDYVKTHSNGYDAYISGYKMTGYIWSYYNYNSDAGVNNIHVLDYPLVHADFMLLEPDSWNDSLRNIYTVVEQDPYNGKYLLEKKRKTRLIPRDTLTFADNAQFSDMYFDLLKYENTDLALADLCFEIRADIQADHRPTSEFLLKEIEKGPANEYFSTIHLNWYADRLPGTEGYRFRQRMYLPNPHKRDRIVNLFIYNPQQEKLSIRNLQVLVFEMTD